MYPITILEKGGKKIFRKYTEDTLRTMFDSSKLGANYEISILIENLVYMLIMSYYALHDETIDYFDFVIRDPAPSLGDGIRKLEKLGIFNEVIEELDEYKKLRNMFSHDPFRMKTMIFNENTISDECEQLFNKGMKLLNTLSPLVQPGVPTVKEWKKRFKATIEGDTIDFRLDSILSNLEKRRIKELKIKDTAKNRKNTKLITTIIKKEIPTIEKIL